MFWCFLQVIDYGLHRLIITRKFDLVFLERRARDKDDEHDNPRENDIESEHKVQSTITCTYHFSSE